MSLIRIESVEDPRVDVYRDLKSPSARRSRDRFVVESLVVTQRLLASGLRVDSVLTDERHVETLCRELPGEIPLYVLPRDLVPQLAGFQFHRGVLACACRPPLPELSSWLNAAPPATWTVCVGVQGPENLGGILRTSAAFGVRGVLLGPHCADPFSRRVARTSMGACFQLPIRVSPDLREDLVQLHDRGGVRLVATVLLPGARPLMDVSVVGRQAILLGSEGTGLEREWQTLCDERVTIPMGSGVDSLNVSVAAGIVLYHFSGRAACGGG